jgi:predicted small metal-binding protein
MYEVSCRDLGMADCDFDVLAFSLERLEIDVIAHARLAHPGQCAGATAVPGSPERRALHERIVAAARAVPDEALVI